MQVGKTMLILDLNEIKIRILHKDPYVNLHKDWENFKEELSLKFRGKWDGLGRSRQVSVVNKEETSLYLSSDYFCYGD